LISAKAMRGTTKASPAARIGSPKPPVSRHSSGGTTTTPTTLRRNSLFGSTNTNASSRRLRAMSVKRRRYAA